MDILFTPNEARVIGCLIEKEITTPDQYPLSLNSLTNACNQKSNRDPVMSLDELTVQQTVDGLIKKAFITDKTGYGSRTTKYKHRFCNTDFGQLKLSDKELGILCALLLRGPQTPGELRSHTNRLCNFNDMQEVESTLQQLMQRNDGPFVAKLSREPGKRESRYMQLFCGDTPPESTSMSSDDDVVNVAATVSEERIENLERRIEELEREILRLSQALNKNE